MRLKVAPLAMAGKAGCLPLMSPGIHLFMNCVCNEVMNIYGPSMGQSPLPRPWTDKHLYPLDNPL